MMLKSTRPRTFKRPSTRLTTWTTLWPPPPFADSLSSASAGADPNMSAAITAAAHAKGFSGKASIETIILHDSLNSQELMGGMAIRYTGRQSQIVELAARGQSDKEIGAALGLSTHTVRSHFQRLYRAQGLSNRAEAVAAWLARQAEAETLESAGADLSPEHLRAEEEQVVQAAAQVASVPAPVQRLPAPAHVELINLARAESGLQPLEWSDELSALAQQSAVRMAACGYLDTVIGALTRADGSPLRAENIGYWSGMNDHQMHALFMADPKQRASILGPYQEVGAGWALTHRGVAFLSVLFS
ncbi:MAG: hypothetical protein E6I70_14540 [Chloroflexi bacterium]|nr:MAG: hypothetical protein E6I70_14540 [Chloroflexota bacterium]